VDYLACYAENINMSKQSITKEAPIDIQEIIIPELKARAEQRLTERNKKKAERAPVFWVGDQE